LPIDTASQLTLAKCRNIPTAYTFCPLEPRKAVHLLGRSVPYLKLSDEHRKN